MSANKGTDDHAGDESKAPEKDQSAAQKAATAPAGSVEQDSNKGAQTQQPKDSGGGQHGADKTASAKASKQPKTEAPKTGASDTRKQQSATAADSKQAATRSAARQSQSAPPGSGNGGGQGKGQDEGSSSKLPVIVAVVALVVAIIALIVAVWLWQQNKQGTQQLTQRIDNVQSDLQASVDAMVSAPLAQMESRIDKAMAQVDSATQAGQQRAQVVAQLQSQLQQTRLQLAGVTQQLQGDARLWWQLEQIENLLTIANRRLQLYEEPAQASSALQLASRMIARINDPRLFKVRKSIVNNIAALDALPSPDIAGMALKLSAFIGQVADLPLVSDIPANYTPESAQATANKGNAKGDNAGIDWSDGWHRFVGSIGNAVQSMATIRRADGTQPALLPPDQVYFLTQNLMLELRAARLALLQGNSTLYRQSLTTATAWLKQYFDTNDAAVQAMLQGLHELQNVKLEWQAPDISSSLRALRAYMHTVSQSDAAEQAEQATNKAKADAASGAAQSAANAQGGQ